MELGRSGTLKELRLNINLLSFTNYRDKAYDLTAVFLWWKKLVRRSQIVESVIYGSDRVVLTPAALSLVY